MGSILDKINEQEDERLASLRKEKEAERAKTFHKGPNGIEFTHVNINKIVRNVWVGEFSFTFHQRLPTAETSIVGSSPEETLKKVERFLQLELQMNQYSINNGNTSTNKNKKASKGPSES